MLCIKPNIYVLREGGFSGSRYERTLSGWFESCTFENWFPTTVLTLIRNLDGPKDVIGVNLYIHLTINVIERLDLLLLLPPHSTHLF